MRYTHERQQVVFAHRPHRDRARQYQLVVVLVVRERRQVERARREQLGVGPGHPPGSVAQALGIQRNAQRREELAGGAFRSGEIDPGGLVQDPQDGTAPHATLLRSGDGRRSPAAVLSKEVWSYSSEWSSSKEWSIFVHDR